MVLGESPYGQKDNMQNSAQKLMFTLQLLTKRTLKNNAKTLLTNKENK